MCGWKWDTGAGTEKQTNTTQGAPGRQPCARSVSNPTSSSLSLFKASSHRLNLLSSPLTPSSSQIRTTRRRTEKNISSLPLSTGSVSRASLWEERPWCAEGAEILPVWSQIGVWAASRTAAAPTPPAARTASSSSSSSSRFPYLVVILI